MIDVKVGSKIPLILQVHDGNPNLDVEAILIDSFGKEFMRAKLGPVSGGLYINNEIEMPSIDILIAQYHTDKPEDYEVAQDVFKAIPKPNPPEKMIVGEVVDKALWDEDVIMGVAYVDEETEDSE